MVEDLGDMNRWAQRTALGPQQYLERWQASCARNRHVGPSAVTAAGVARLSRRRAARSQLSVEPEGIAKEVAFERARDFVPPLLRGDWSFPKERNGPGAGRQHHEIEGLGRLK